MSVTTGTAPHCKWSPLLIKPMWTLLIKDDAATINNFFVVFYSGIMLVFVAMKS